MDSEFLLDEPPVAQGRAGGKFQPRAKQRPRKEISANAPPAPPVDTRSESKGLGVPAPSQLVADTLPSENADIFFGLESLDARVINSCVVRLETEEARAFPGVEGEQVLSDIDVESGECLGKPSADSTQHSVVRHPPDIESIPCRAECVESSIPAPPGDILHYSPININDFVALDPSASNLPMNEGRPNLEDLRSAHDTISVDVHRMCERELREQSHETEIIDELEDELLYDASPGPEPSTRLHADKDKGNEGDPNLESGSPEKRASRKLKNLVVEKGKQAQKPEKANEVSDWSAEKPPRKFPHATRRKRRCVDKTLLETPEDELDHQRIPLRDLILLAEHREWLASKDAKTSKVPSKEQSTSKNALPKKDAQHEESSCALEQDIADEQASSGIQEDATFFNYHSFMNKEPRAKWSKQETELFYEAIRQFGSDFSLIQQLFPGRSRHQIRLKFKSEERRHPMRLSEAVVTRGKDHSYFQKVIGQLQQATAQAEGGPDEDDSIDMTVIGEEVAEDFAPETNVKAAELVDNMTVENQVSDVPKVCSPRKSEENCDDNDDDIWNSYKSVF